MFSNFCQRQEGQKQWSKERNVRLANLNCTKMADDYSDFIIQEPEKSIRTRLVERFKGQPFLMAGWMGTLGALIYGAYRFKTRGATIKPSVFAVQLRVFAQGAIVGSLTLGMLYETYRKQVEKRNEKTKN